ncbi:MAG: FIST N-terminal domain-containing protein [Pseudobdellovibrio sp.]
MKIKILQFYKNKWSESFPVELDSENTWITVVSNSKRTDFTPLQDLKKHFAKSTLIGCSSAGEIFNDGVFDDSLSVSICMFEKTILRSIEVKINSSADSLAIGKSIGDTLNAKDLKAIFVLSDGLNINGTELAMGINSKVNTSTKTVPVSGGLSGDGSDFKSTFTLYGDVVSTKQVVAVGFYGDKLTVGTGSVGGWDAFGAARKVTKSKGNVLLELDGQPALKLYKEYLGGQASKLPASALLYPLSISYEQRKDIVRTILAVDEKDQSLTFAGDIPEGSVAQLMKANFSRLVEGAESAGIAASNFALKSTSAILALAVSCVGRRLVLGEKIEDETEAVIRILPNNSKMIGFYSYGELSPNGNYGCELHNQTMTLTVFQEME